MLANYSRVNSGDRETRIGGGRSKAIQWPAAAIPVTSVDLHLEVWHRFATPSRSFEALPAIVRTREKAFQAKAILSVWIEHGSHPHTTRETILRQRAMLHKARAFSE
jgi:hypothetical protein